MEVGGSHIVELTVAPIASLVGAVSLKAVLRQLLVFDVELLVGHHV